MDKRSRRTFVRDDDVVLDEHRSDRPLSPRGHSEYSVIVCRPTALCQT